MTSAIETLSAPKLSTIPGITIRKVSIDAPWDWFSAGWRDIWVYPHISLGFGATFALLAILTFFGLSMAGLQSLILVLAGGFLLIGPAIAVGLYALSRQIEAGERVTLRSVLLSGLNAPGQLGFLGAILMFIYYIWIQIALLIFMLFFGGTPFPPASQFIPTLLFEPHGLGLLITGTIVGSILAAIAFAVAVVSVPLVTVRRLDAISAIHVSLKAVAFNARPMALWAAIIGFVTAIGILTCAVGLIFVFPQIGHASWHAFRDLIELE